MDNIIDEKIALLKDFHILSNRTTKREKAVRHILDGLTETQIDQKLHDVLCGNKTLQELIEQYV